MLPNAKMKLDKIVYLLSGLNCQGPFISDNNGIICEVLASLLHLICGVHHLEGAMGHKMRIA
jgi:hypothetical protein